MSNLSDFIIIPPSLGTPIEIKDENIQVKVSPSFINFAGDGVETTPSGNGVVVTIPGGGGGGGSGIKGTWDVTPAYTPPSFTLPNFTEPVLPQANFDSFTVVDEVATLVTNFGTNPGGATVRSAAGILDLQLDFIADAVKSYRFQMGFGTLADYSTDPVYQIPFFGLVQPSLANNSSLQTFLSSLVMGTYVGSEFFRVAMFRNNAGDLESEFHSQGASAYAVEVGTTTGAHSATNTVDIYASQFDGQPLGQPGTPILSLVAVPNSTIGGSEPGNFIYPSMAGQTEKLVPIFGVLSYDTVGGSVFLDLTLEVNFLAAHTQVEASHLAHLGPPPQNLLDDLLGNPVAAIGVNTPASYVQVATLPVGAAVHDLYIADVSNSYAGELWEVKPLNKWVKQNEILRISNLSPAAFDVFNEWRDSGGAISITDVPLTSTAQSIGPTITKTVDVNGNETYSSAPGEVSSAAFAAFIDQLIYSAPNDDIAKSEAPEINSRFRWEFGHKPFVGTSSFRQSVTTTLTSGSKIAVVEFETDGYHGLQAATGGSLIGEGRTYFILQSGGGVTDLETTIHSPGINVTCSAVSGTFAVGDIVSDFSNGVIMELDGFGLPSKIALPNYTIPGALAFEGSTLTSTSGQFTLDLVGDPLLLLTEPALQSGSFTLYYDEYNSPFRKAIPVVHFGKNLINGFTEYLEVSQANIVISQDDLIKAATYVEHEYISKNSSLAGTYIRQDIPGPRSGLGYSAVLFLPRLGITSRLDPYAAIAHELDFTARTITFRFKTVDAVEHSYTLSAQYLTDEASLGVEPIFGTSNRIIQPLSTFSGDGTTTVWTTGSGVDVVMPEVRLWKTTVAGELVRLTASDFSVTNFGEITFTVAPLLGETVGGEYLKGNGGVTVFPGYDTQTPSVGQAVEFFEGLIDSYLESTKFAITFASFQGHADVFINYGYGSSWERPNPEAYAPYIQKAVGRTPTLGNLFVVDEQFNPTLGQEMKYKVMGALAPVTASAWFNGKQFLKGNYARWDGGRTMPFPDTARVPTYEPFSTNTIVVPSASEFVVNVDSNIMNRINILELPNSLPTMYLICNSASLGVSDGNWVSFAFTGSYSNITVNIDGAFDRDGNFMSTLNMLRGRPYRFIQIDNSFYLD